jgi:hypothetical protein
MRLHRNKMWGWVDPNQPINWNHPVNFGLVSWWLNLPNGQWGGGRTFRDINRSRQNEGALTGFSFPNTATSGWQGPQGRPGGYGSLGFDGADDRVIIANSAQLNAMTAVTVACWFRPAAGGSGLVQGFAGKTAEIWTDVAFSCRYLPDTATSGHFDFVTTSDGSSISTLTTGTVATSGWHHVAYTAGAGGRAIYFDGGLAASDGTSSPLWTNTQPVLLGGYSHGAGLSFLWTGLLDDVRIHNCALSVYALYDQSRQGYQSVLRWLSTRAYFLPPARGGLLLARRRAAG